MNVRYDIIRRLRERRLSMNQSFRQKLKQKWTYYRGWKWIIFIGLTIGLLLSTYLVVIAKTTNVDILLDGLQSDTTVYTYDDQWAGELNSQKGNYVTLEYISSEMKTTVVSVEDKRFYEHTGFDTIGLGRAFVRLLINRDTSGGGGSTLTQQLVKNAFLTLDQTFERKLKEFFLALEVEKTYTKDQILEMYLNHAYFGNGVWGVEDASMKYFGHPASTLNWNESMVLTGILKGPNIFNPIDDYEAAVDRREVIAGVLANDGVIEEWQEHEINNSPIYLYDNYYDEDYNQFPQYFDAVINEAIEVTNIPDVDLLSKGYKIYTYLNPAYQNSLDNSYANTWVFPDDGTGEPLVQSASMVMDPQTGGIMAVYGGRGDYTYRGFNRATDMYRSPGSTIKPLAVYVPALEAGYDSYSMVPDVVKGYGTNNYAPENYNHYTEPSGETELYYALAQSKNTSAVHLMDELSIATSVRKLRQFGIEVPQEDQHLTLALGAMSQGVSLEQLTNAYSAFANRGIRVESSFIRRIEDATGKVVYRNENPSKHMVMTPNVAAEMTSMMLDTYGGYGTGYGAGPTVGNLAGKTGSTEVGDGDMATRDRWMVGYTPDFVITTWVGMDEIGEVTLDELMPTGLGTLFSAQTTDLMYNSPMTSFQVGMASQYQGNEQDFDFDSWEEDASDFFDEAGQFIGEATQWIGEQVGNLWEQGSQVIRDLMP